MALVTAMATCLTNAGSAAARAFPRASATAEEMWLMRAGRAEGTARAAQGATAWQTAARLWTSVACAEGMGSPRENVIALVTSLMSAVSAGESGFWMHVECVSMLGPDEASGCTKTAEMQIVSQIPALP